MIECLILGDSIAKGISTYRPDCVSYSKSGINSSAWNRKYYNHNTHAITTIISLGSNDYKNKTELELRFLRAEIKSERVYWILPAIKPDIQSIIKLIASDWGDTVLPITKLSPDKVHPTGLGYKELAIATK
jgi:hypothetical protein